MLNSFSSIQVWDLTGKGFTNQMMLHSSYALAGMTLPPYNFMRIAIAQHVF